MTSGQMMIASAGSAAPGRAPARQLARQERIVAVAMRHFAERGYEGVRIEEIAREAGVAKGAVFGYWVPYRVTLIGNYCSSLQLRREITQFLLREDPYGTQAFVQFGVERGEIRRDIDAKMVVSLVDWLMDRCQDAIVTEELDPGLFGAAAESPQMRDVRVQQFVELLRSAIGAGSASGAGRPE
jgi:Bacterial regulatory proteins, tetR family